MFLMAEKAICYVTFTISQKAILVEMPLDNQMNKLVVA